MGNLCSSGTERTDKKEDNRAPDKPREGEDEALLAAGGAELGVGPEGVQVSVEGEGGGGGTGDGFGGFLSGAAKSGESAFTEVNRSVKEECQTAAAAALQSGREATDKIVEDVQSSTKAAINETAAGTTAVAKETVAGGIESVNKKATEAYQSAAERLEESAGHLASGITNVVGSVKSEAHAVGSEAEVRAESVNKDVSGSADIRSGTETVTEEAIAPPPLEAKGGIFGNVAEEFGKKACEIKATAVSVAESIEQTAENKANEAVESAKLSASETAAAWAETVTQKVSGLAGNVSQTASESQNDLQNPGNVHELAQDIDEENQHSISEPIGEGHVSADNKQENISDFFSGAQSAFGDIQQFGDLEQSVEDEKENTAKWLTGAEADLQPFAYQQTQNIQQYADSVIQSAADSIANDRTSLEQHDVQDVNAGFGELKNEVDESFSSLDNTAAAKSDNSHVRDLEQDIRDALEGVSLEGFRSNVTQIDGTTDSAGKSALNEASLQQQHPAEESDSLFNDIQTAIKELDKSREPYTPNQVVENVDSYLTGATADVADEERESMKEILIEAVQVSGSEENFIEKAKSLLEAHRNSVDGSKVHVPAVNVTDLSDQDSENVEQTDNSENASHEATAREFVESIIEKASSLVSESVEQNEPESENSSPSDPCVERGEETLAPKKRGVMFVSPQISDKSSSSLSSPPELSPPPPHESDLSPPGESSSSSISQSDLVETDELLIPPSLPAEFSVSESNNNNNNLLNNNAEDDDESIHRVAMEVTAKAVQDAIKIVSENGTGSVLNCNSILSNDVGITSPSSPENDDEEMTTTDSSQVERGSPVSDITDTSAHGSVSESLSSYDPGAAFRQDVANLADLALSPGDSNISAQPGTQWAPDASHASSKIDDLINFEEGPTSQGETPTPTNATSFDAYAHPSQQGSSVDQQKSDINPPPSFPSEVPFSFSSFDEELSTSPNKPTIIINSPDSAHHTNGSTEDLSTSQTEALI